MMRSWLRIKVQKRRFVLVGKQLRQNILQFNFCLIIVGNRKVMKDELTQRYSHFHGKRGQLDIVFQIQTIEGASALHVCMNDYLRMRSFSQVIDQVYLKSNQLMYSFFPTPEELIYYLIKQFEQLRITEDGTIVLALSIVGMLNKKLQISIPTTRKEIDKYDLLNIKIKKLEEEIRQERQRHEDTLKKLEESKELQHQRDQTVERLTEEFEAVKQEQREEKEKIWDELNDLKDLWKTKVREEQSSLKKELWSKMKSEIEDRTQIMSQLARQQMTELKKELARQDESLQYRLRQSTVQMQKQMESRLYQVTEYVKEVKTRDRESQILEEEQRQIRQIGEEIRRNSMIIKGELQCREMCKSSVILRKQQASMQKVEFIMDCLKSPLKVEIIYRASENKFSSELFHKKCDGISNTFVLIQTQYGKVLGGFTPLTWNSAKEGYANDEKCQSFLISLDLLEKFELNSPAHAIFCSNDHGPTFGGGHDICISDNCKKVESSCFSFPQSYHGNGRYECSEETWAALCGNPNGCTFKVKEYEVFRVFY